MEHYLAVWPKLFSYTLSYSIEKLKIFLDKAHMYSPVIMTFNTKSLDVLAYVEEIFNLSETKFRETYAEYSVVIEKMEEMVKVLRKYGVNVY